MVVGSNPTRSTKDLEEYSSAVERFVYTEDVAGSIPATPTEGGTTVYLY